MIAVHIYFPVTGRRAHMADADGATDAGQMLVLRDQQDESEWQYLGNPEVAARTSLSEIVSQFIQDCRSADGVIDPAQRAAAMQVRDGLLQAAAQVDDALKDAQGR